MNSLVKRGTGEYPFSAPLSLLDLVSVKIEFIII